VYWIYTISEELGVWIRVEVEEVEKEKGKKTKNQRMDKLMQGINRQVLVGKGESES
jgi:hypothetical protein